MQPLRMKCWTWMDTRHSTPAKVSQPCARQTRDRVCTQGMQPIRWEGNQSGPHAAEAHWTLRAAFTKHSIAWDFPLLGEDDVVMIDGFSSVADAEAGGCSKTRRSALGGAPRGRHRWGCGPPRRRWCHGVAPNRSTAWYAVPAKHSAWPTPCENLGMEPGYTSGQPELECAVWHLLADAKGKEPGAQYREEDGGRPIVLRCSPCVLTGKQ